MAGTIPLSLTQQFDELGKPLSGGLLYIIQAGTVNTPQNPYQDYGLTILQPNPIPLDAAGRVPQFFLADGFIKFNLTNYKGVTQIARDGVLVIGPSSGSGGGGGVDPTTLIQTGMVAYYYGTGILTGYVRANFRTIGNAASGATERANADTQALWIFLYGADPNLAVSGGRTGNALTDYNNNKQLTLPDARGRLLAGLDDMGNTPIGRLTATYFGASGVVLGAASGQESRQLTPLQVPNITSRNAALPINVTGASTGPAGARLLPNAGTNCTAFGPSGNHIEYNNGTDTGAIPVSASGTVDVNLTSNNTSGSALGNAHATVQPTMVVSMYLKL